MVSVIVSVDEDDCVEQPDGVPWHGHAVESDIRTVVAGGVVAAGRRTASYLDDWEDVVVVSNDQGSRLRDVVERGRRDDDVYLLGGLHIFHQVFRQGVVETVHVFRVADSFGGEERLVPGAFDRFDLAKEVVRSTYRYQLFMARDASGSRFAGRG